jgi:hypothetical protein
MTGYPALALAASAAAPARAGVDRHQLAHEQQQQQQQSEPPWLFAGAADPRNDSRAAQPQHLAPALSRPCEPHYAGHHHDAYHGQQQQQQQHEYAAAGKQAMQHKGGQQQPRQGEHGGGPPVKKELDKEDVDFLVDILSAEDLQPDTLDVNALSPAEIPGPMGSPMNLNLSLAAPVLRRNTSNQECEAFPLAGPYVLQHQAIQQRVFATARPRWASYPAASPPFSLIPLAQSGSNPFLLLQERAQLMDEAQSTLKRMRSNNMVLQRTGSQRILLAPGAEMKRVRSSDVAGASSDDEGDAVGVKVEVETAQLAKLQFVRCASSEGDDDSDGEAGGPDRRERSASKMKRPWTPLEERVMLHLVYSFCDRDLRTISALSQKCDLHRSTRAIDKKLKRIVFFDKWHSRSQDNIRAKIIHIVTTQPLALPADVQRMIDNVAREGNAPNLLLLTERDGLAAA